MKLTIEKQPPARILNIVQDEMALYNEYEQAPKVLAERLNGRLNAIGWWAYAGGHHVAIHIKVPTSKQEQAGERYLLIETV